MEERDILDDCVLSIDAFGLGALGGLSRETASDGVVAHDCVSVVSVPGVVIHHVDTAEKCHLRRVVKLLSTHAKFEWAVTYRFDPYSVVFHQRPRCPEQNDASILETT